MAKQTDFAEKARKAAQEKGVKCPKCGTTKTPTLYVQSVRSAHGPINSTDNGCRSVSATRRSF